MPLLWALSIQMEKTLIVLSVLLIVACGTKQRPDTSMLPCYEGWTVDASGKSVVWQPTQKFWDELVSQIPKGRTVDCWHKMPDGRFLIPNVDSSGNAYVNTFKEINGVYKMILEEYLVSSD